MDRPPPIGRERGTRPTIKLRDKKIKFTAKGIEALKPNKDKMRYELFEDDAGPGRFGYRVSPRGGVSWTLRYWFKDKDHKRGGHWKRVTIGTYRKNLSAPVEMTLAQARVRCAEMRRDVAVGIDPGAEIVIERKAERDAETVEDLISAFVEAHVSRLRSAVHTERYLRCVLRCRKVRRAGPAGDIRASGGVHHDPRRKPQPAAQLA